MLQPEGGPHSGWDRHAVAFMPSDVTRREMMILAITQASVDLVARSCLNPVPFRT